MTRRPEPVDPHDVVEFVVHGALAPRLIDWLASQGFDVTDFPKRDDPDALRCLMVTPGQALWDSLALPDDGLSIKCPRCQRVSYNPNDVRERYCGACHEYHETMPR